MCSRLTTEARAPQSCFMVPGEGAAGRAKALLGWVGRQGKTVAQLPHSSQPSQGRVFAGSRTRSCPFSSLPSWIQLTFPKEGTNLTGWGLKHRLLKGLSQLCITSPEEAHPGQHCINWAAGRPFTCRALDSVQHWGINTAIQTSFVCFLYSLTGSSAAVLCGESVFPIYLRGMFSFIAAWWSVWLRQSKKLLSALGLTSLKKEVCWKK